MTQHAGLPVAGYVPQTDEKVQTVNRAKKIEERALRHLDDLKMRPDVDQRMVAIAFTGIKRLSCGPIAPCSSRRGEAAGGWRMSLPAFL